MTGFLHMRIPCHSYFVMLYASHQEGSQITTFDNSFGLLVGETHISCLEQRRLVYYQGIGASRGTHGFKCG